MANKYLGFLAYYVNHSEAAPVIMNYTGPRPTFYTLGDYFIEALGEDVISAPLAKLKTVAHHLFLTIAASTTLCSHDAFRFVIRSNEELSNIITDFTKTYKKLKLTSAPLEEEDEYITSHQSSLDALAPYTKEGRSPKKRTKKSLVKKTTTKKSPVKKTTKKSPVKKTTKKSPVKKTTKKSPAKKTTKNSPVKKTTKNSPVKKKSPEKVATSKGAVTIIKSIGSKSFALLQTKLVPAKFLTSIDARKLADIKDHGPGWLILKSYLSDLVRFLSNKGVTINYIQ